MFAERRTTKNTKSTKKEEEVQEVARDAMSSLFVSFVLFVVQKGLMTVYGPKYPAGLSLHRNSHSGFEHGENGGNREQIAPLCFFSDLLFNDDSWGADS